MKGARVLKECVAASISHLMFKNCQTGFRNLQLKENYTHLNCHAFLLSVCQYFRMLSQHNNTSLRSTHCG